MDQVQSVDPQTTERQIEEEFVEIIHRNSHEGIEVVTGITNQPCRCGDTTLWRTRVFGLNDEMRAKVVEYWRTTEEKLAEDEHFRFRGMKVVPNKGCSRQPRLMECVHNHALTCVDLMLHDLVTTRVERSKGGAP